MGGIHNYVCPRGLSFLAEKRSFLVEKTVWAINTLCLFFLATFVLNRGVVQSAGNSCHAILHRLQAPGTPPAVVRPPQLGDSVRLASS